MSSKRKFNPDTQKLVDIETQGAGHWVRIYCKDGEVFEGYARYWTTTEVDDDEDADALSFVRRDQDSFTSGGIESYTVAGVEIDRFEVLEKR